MAPRWVFGALPCCPFVKGFGFGSLRIYRVCKRRCTEGFLFCYRARSCLDCSWGQRRDYRFFFVVVSVAVASVGKDFLVVVVAVLSVLALAGVGVLDHPHLA